MLTTRWFVVGSFLLCACGASQAKPSSSPVTKDEPREAPLGPVHEKGKDKLIATVGQDGGTLELGNGGRLEIPPGALAEPIEITLAAGGKTTAFSNREYERTVGPTLEVAPALQLALPIKVSIPLSRLPDGFEEDDLAMATEVQSDNQRAIEMTGTQTRWDYNPARSSDGRITGELSAIPGMRVQFVVSRGN